MTSLKSMIRAANTDAPSLYVAPRHARWLEQPENEQIYSAEAIQFVADALAGKFLTERSGRVSASSLGECPRKVLFGYAGAPKLGEDPDSQDLMGLGKWGHLRWQAEGISAGWIDGPAPNYGAELFYKGDLAGGTVDAVMVDDSIFELKTVHTFVYSRIVEREREPKRNHLLQVNCYFLLRGKEGQIASIVYEDRSSGSFHEFRVRPDRDYIDEVTAMLKQFSSWLEALELPEMLDECQMRVGNVYRNCPFRLYCPKQGNVLRIAGA